MKTNLIIDAIFDGKNLFPCRERGKEPLRGCYWKDYTGDVNALHAHISVGGNLGWNLGAEYFVIDVDGRNNGDVSLRRLENSLGYILQDVTRGVRTGDGMHFYFRLAEANRALGSKILGYEGIDVKRNGGYVLIPPSIHPSGARYEFVNDLPIAEADEKLLTKLTYRLPMKEVGATGGCYTFDDISYCLRQIPAVGFKIYEEWFKMMAAVHHASGGAAWGFDLFCEWSMSDSDYGNANTNDWLQSWNTLSNQRVQPITFGTIRYQVRQNGGDTTPIDARLIFDGIPVETSLEDVLSAVEELTPASGAPAIRQTLAMTANLSPIEQQESIAAFTAKIGHAYPAATLKQELREIKKKAAKDDGRAEDVIADLGGKVLADSYQNGKSLMVTSAEELYRWNGRFWHSYPQPVFERVVQEHCKSKQISRLTVSVSSYVFREVAREDNPFSFLPQESLFAVQNGELRVQPDKISLSPHNPESWTQYLINAEWSEKDTGCPHYVKMMNEFFEPYNDGEEIIRHLEELFGYICQGRKSVPVFMLWRGHGANGKSTLAGILQYILGDSATPQSIVGFDISRNRYAFSSLVGKLLLLDDDFPEMGLLPDAAIKLMSESKPLTAEPKFKQPYTFYSRATPIILTNTYPRITDASFALARRAHCIPFTRQFIEDGDPLLSEKLQSEANAIFRRWIAGYQRFLQRGRKFIIPKTMEEEAAKWLATGNPIRLWLETVVKDPGGVGVTLTEAFTHYQNWATNEGYKMSYGRSQFNKRLIATGAWVDNASGGGIYMVRGIKLPTIDSDKFSEE